MNGKRWTPPARLSPSKKKIASLHLFAFKDAMG